MVKLFNIAKMTTATSGTGTVTLGSAVSGYISFADAGVTNGDVVTYVLEEGSNREIGRGTYTAAGTTLSRDTVLNSTAGGTTKITLAGAAQVFITAAQEDILHDGIATITSVTEGSDFLGVIQSGVLKKALLSNVFAGRFNEIGIQTFTGSGTYTPSADMLWCLVISTGGGGGGGGADVSANNNIGVGGGGGAGGTCIEFFSAATIGASQTVTIGAAGTAGTAANGGTGGTGGNTTFGALHTANGGVGGTGSGVASGDADTSAGGAGGTPTGGTLNIVGGSGSIGLGVAGGDLIGNGGTGGGSFWGTGGSGGASAATTLSALTSAGTAGTTFGSGGGGAISTSTTGAAGGAGAAGVCIVIEFKS